MWNVFYNGLLLIASPVILVLLLAKPRCRRGLPQRFGFTTPRISPDHRPLIWMHAVSLGEVVAITPLVRELHRRHPDHRFAVSTATETGRDAVEQRLAGLAEHLYAPLDFPWAVSRTIDRLRPALYVFIETELWPNLLGQLSRRGVPAVMVNGRLSTKSFARQRRAPVRWLYESMLRSLRLCLMQSDRDAERIIALGADPRSVHRTGNIKFDQPLPAASERKVSRIELGLAPAPEAPLLVAGSTHAVEEEMLVDAYQALLAGHPSAQLLIAPRHIERADAVEAMVRGRGLTVRRRSRIPQLDTDWRTQAACRHSRFTRRVGIGVSRSDRRLRRWDPCSHRWSQFIGAGLLGQTGPLRPLYRPLCGDRQSPGAGRRRTSGEHGRGTDCAARTAV